MKSVELSEHTAAALAKAAQDLNVSVDEFVRSHLLATTAQNTSALASDFDSDLNGLLFSGPSLPADFSRADIYSDHN